MGEEESPDKFGTSTSLQNSHLGCLPCGEAGGAKTLSETEKTLFEEISGGRWWIVKNSLKSNFAEQMRPFLCHFFPKF